MRSNLTDFINVVLTIEGEGRVRNGPAFFSRFISEVLNCLSKIYLTSTGCYATWPSKHPLQTDLYLTEDYATILYLLTYSGEKE